MIRRSHIAGAYDTETTTLGERTEARAFPCVYICSDLTAVDLREYAPGEGERIELFRYRPDVLEWLERLIADGFRRESTPIVCVYNMMFDLAPLMEELAADEEVVRVKEIEFEPLTEEEALVKIDLLGHDFFAYTDRDTSMVNVLYRRDDGGYGLLKQREEA